MKCNQVHLILNDVHLSTVVSLCMAYSKMGDPNNLNIYSENGRTVDIVTLSLIFCNLTFFVVRESL